MNRLNWCGVVLAAVAVLGLSGCPVPIPPTGYERQSRTNLPDQVPDFIVTGKTTRQEVLLSLGMPDSSAADGRWIAYRTSKHAGGVLFVVPYGGLGVSSTDEQLLIVRFDPYAIVIDATLEKRTCPHLVPGDPAPCLELPDPASVDALVELETGATSDVYELVRWALGESHPNFLPARHTGRILLTTHGMLAIDESPSEGGAQKRYWIPYEQIARTEMSNTSSSRSWGFGVLHLMDGRSYSLVVVSGTGMSRRPDTAATRRLISQISRALEDGGKQH